eukprot:8690660-Pyramimonas_sp.AAC.1
MAMSSLDSTGRALAGKFARWTADEQSRAFTMKQQRMHQEEKEDKRRGPSDKGPKGGKEKGKRLRQPASVTQGWSRPCHHGGRSWPLSVTPAPSRGGGQRRRRPPPGPAAAPAGAI